MLPFDFMEYQDRLRKTKQRMEKQGIEVLLVTDPANMNYLSGYDAWSFYVHQMLVVIIDEPQPIWIGRYMDAVGARNMTWLYEENVIAYPDYYVHSTDHHPMEFIAEILTEIGQGSRAVGVEMDNYYFSAQAFMKLQAGLPNAIFKNADLLVNWVRSVKSEQELEYMRCAGQIAENAMAHGIETIHAGVRQSETAAMLYYHLVSGTKEHGGDYPSIVPFLPTGKDTGTPHATWSDKPLKEGENVTIELAGCYKRYHVPLARTVSIGFPSEKSQRFTSIIREGLSEVMDRIRPGMTCGEIDEAWKRSIAKYGIEKEARLGYSVGLNYPPDWGEHTASVRVGDPTIVQPNMTFHLIPALWFENEGIEISETIRITETGCETFTNFSRELIVQEPANHRSHGGIIS